MGHKRKLTFPEEHLIRLIRERHPDGAKALYHMYGYSLYGVISRIIMDAVLSEDILQDCFIKVWENFDSYNESRGRLYTWISNIARNMAIDQIRSKGFRNSQRHQRISDCYEELYENEVSSVNVDMRFFKDRSQ